MKITAQMVMASSEFMKMVVPEAIQKVADINKASYQAIHQAYKNGYMKVRENVDSLVIEAAEETAKRMNRKTH